MENNIEQNLNPWVSIWTQPRATIQQIIDTDPERSVLVLAAIAGITQILDRAVGQSVGDIVDWLLILLISIVLGPFAGIIGLYVTAGLIYWTGTWIGGKGTPKTIRAAIAWSNVPGVWLLILWIPKFILFGEEAVTTETPRIDADPLLIAILFGYALIGVVVAIWTTVILFKCLGQVQGFSAWKAWGNTILSTLVFGIPFILLMLGIMSFVR